MDTSIGHAVLYSRDAAGHRPRKKWCACIVHVLDRIVLRSSSNGTGARLFSNVFGARFVFFGSCFAARIGGREQDYKRRSPNVGLHRL